MSETSIVSQLKGSLELQSSKLDQQEKERAEQAAFEEKFQESAKAFHGLCGRILFEEMKAGRVTETELGRGFRSHDLSSRYESLDLDDRARVHYGGWIGMMDQATGEVAVPRPEADDNMSVSVKVHFVRPMEDSSSKEKGRGLLVPHVRKALVGAEIVAIKDKVRAVKIVDIHYDMFAGAQYVCSDSNTLHWVRPEERQEILTPIQDANALLGMVVQQYAETPVA